MISILGDIGLPYPTERDLMADLQQVASFGALEDMAFAYLFTRANA
jgi:hypothetical protein